MKPVIVAVMVGLCLLACQSVSSAAEAFVETNGRVMVEIESAPASEGWTPQTDLKGFTGQCYYTWTGPDMPKQPGTGVLRYVVQIVQGGTYTLTIRNRHDLPDHTKQNDCYTRMDGGPWLKTFSSKEGLWTWHSRHHWTETIKGRCLYVLTPGVHVLEISGRSAGLSIDRLSLSHSQAGKWDELAPPSPTVTVSDAQIAQATTRPVVMPASQPSSQPATAPASGPASKPASGPESQPAGR